MSTVSMSSVALVAFVSHTPPSTWSEPWHAGDAPVSGQMGVMVQMDAFPEDTNFDEPGYGMVGNQYGEVLLFDGSEITKVPLQYRDGHDRREDDDDDDDSASFERHTLLQRGTPGPTFYGIVPPPANANCEMEIIAVRVYSVQVGTPKARDGSLLPLHPDAQGCFINTNTRFYANMGRGDMTSIAGEMFTNPVPGTEGFVCHNQWSQDVHHYVVDIPPGGIVPSRIETYNVCPRNGPSGPPPAPPSAPHWGPSGPNWGHWGPSGPVSGPVWYDDFMPVFPEEPEFPVTKSNWECRDEEEFLDDVMWVGGFTEGGLFATKTPQGGPPHMEMYGHKWWVLPDHGNQRRLHACGGP